MATNEIERELGRLSERTESHHDRLESIEQKIDHIVKILDQAQGGWRSLVAVGTISAGLAAFAGHIIDWFLRNR